MITHPRSIAHLKSQQGHASYRFTVLSYVFLAVPGAGHGTDGPRGPRGAEAGPAVRAEADDQQLAVLPRLDETSVC